MTACHTGNLEPTAQPVVLSTGYTVPFAGGSADTFFPSLLGFSLRLPLQLDLSENLLSTLHCLCTLGVGGA